MRRIAMVLCLVLTAGCDPGAKVFRAGPFSGQVIDAETGQPVPGAFVGFRWSGQDAIHGSTGCLHAVLVQADDEGGYAVPWQGDRLNTSGAVGVGWSQAVWAPGYVLLKTGEGNLLRAGIVKAARDPSVDIEKGVEEAKREQTVTVGTRNTVIPLQRATSAMEALDMNNRLEPDYYSCGNEYNQANRETQRALGLALYRDSYHRVCEEELPYEALTPRYLQLPQSDYQSYRSRDPVAEAEFHSIPNLGADWVKFEYTAGWMKPVSGRVKVDPPFDRAQLPELCRLQRFPSALSGVQP